MAGYSIAITTEIAIFSADTQALRPIVIRE
jgi:hypothetical protein